MMEIPADTLDPSMNILDLPAETLGDIADYAGGLTCTIMQFTCKRFAAVVLDKTIPHRLLPEQAARWGHLELLKWLHVVGCLRTDRVCDAAARGGHLDVLKWLRLEREVYQWSTTTTAIAAKYGHLEVFQWLCDEGCPYDQWAFKNATCNGHLELTKWLYTRGLYISFPASCIAKHFHILKWAYSVGYILGYDTISQAATTGDLEMIKWLMERGCPWDGATTANAAGGGHLEVLKFLRSNGCPWDANTTDRASDMGHTDVLKWAIENGCPLDWEYGYFCPIGI